MVGHFDDQRFSIVAPPVLLTFPVGIAESVVACDVLPLLSERGHGGLQHNSRIVAHIGFVSSILDNGLVMTEEGKLAGNSEREIIVSRWSIRLIES